WQIEEWHRVLKSGCRIEKLGHKTAERLRRVIAINLVIAWRIMLMKQMYRKTPELPAEVLFSDMEILTLKAYAKKKGFRPPDTVGAAIFIVAKFGGYQARKSDPPPGDQIIWRGYSTLQMMSAGFELFMGLSNDKG
ncbi:MAG: transposase, partial [Candidatus Sabulitectum sp.]|nr:transposase [Candidatus Sabulitectum sp.]